MWVLVALEVGRGVVRGVAGDVGLGLGVGVASGVGVACGAGVTVTMLLESGGEVRPVT